MQQKFQRNQTFLKMSPAELTLIETPRRDALVASVGRRDPLVGSAAKRLIIHSTSAGTTSVLLPPHFSQGPAGQVRPSEGPACRVRRTMLDYPSRLRGHDRHAPPNVFSNASQVRVPKTLCKPDAVCRRSCIRVVFRVITPAPCLPR